MMQSLVKFRDKKKGFTLVELIVVIAIIGILAAILMPRFMGFTDDAKKNAAIAEAKNIWSIEQADYAKSGSWPAIAKGATKDANDNDQYTITLADGTTVYTFDGVIDDSAGNGNFTYKRWEGKATNIWTVTCTNGNIVTTKS